MKLSIIIFGISLLIQILIRTRNYNILDILDGTVERMSIINIISFLTLIASFITIIILL